MNIGGFPALPQDWRAVPTVVAIPGVRMAIAGLVVQFCWHSDALLPSVAAERMIVEYFMLVQVVAAAAVPR
jgi:hypothetical protein